MGAVDHLVLFQAGVLADLMHPDHPATVPFAAALVGVFAPPVRCPRSWSGSQTPARWPSANPTNAVLIWTLKNQPGQLERLRSDRHNVPVLIGEHDQSQLQPTLIGHHQPAIVDDQYQPNNDVYPCTNQVELVVHMVTRVRV